MQTFRPTPRTRQNDPDVWIDQLFSSKAAKNGAVVRRAISWVHREIGQKRFFDEVQARGFRLLQTADQYVVICHGGPVHMLF